MQRVRSEEIYEKAEVLQAEVALLGGDWFKEIFIFHTAFYVARKYKYYEVEPRLFTLFDRLSFPRTSGEIVVTAHNAYERGRLMFPIFASHVLKEFGITQRELIDGANRAR